MAILNTITVNHRALNESLQIGDTIYYAKNTINIQGGTANPNQLAVQETTGGGYTVNIGYSALAGSVEGAYDYYQQGLVDITSDNDIVKIGVLSYFSQLSTPSGGIQSPTIELKIISESYLDPLPNNVYLFFSKDNRANLASLTGYYGLARLKNNSRNKAELYAVSSEAVQSSK
jgi:hypothetical protein